MKVITTTKYAQVAPVQPQQPQQPQQARPGVQPGQSTTDGEEKIQQFLQQNRAKLPPQVQTALQNPAQRAIVIALVDSMADPKNQQFINQFVAMTKQIMSDRKNQPQAAANPAV